MRACVTIGIAAALGALFGCMDERRYVGDGDPIQVALTADTAPAFASDDGAVFIVEQRVELPVREPPDTALSDLRQGAERYEDLPFPRLPYVARDDLAIEVDFTLANLDDDERAVAVIVNGWNEFHEYQPGVTVIDDEPTPDFSQWERLYLLEPRERITRTIREEEFDEMAVDLATVVNGAPNSNAIVFFENKSSDDERSRAFIPAVVPGLLGFRLGLRATSAANVVLEAVVRVRDTEDRLADDGERLFEVDPQPFMPVAGEL